MTISITAKSRTLTNGTANDATPVEANFTELYNNDSTLATGINGVLGTPSTNSAVDGKFLVLRNSFSGSPGATDHGGLRIYRGAVSSREIRWNETNTWWEASHDGTNYFPVSLVTASDPASPANGYIWYNSTSNTLKAYVNGSTDNIITTSTQAYPTRHLSCNGPMVTYTSANSVTIKSNTRVRNSTDTANINITSDIAISLGSSGANGLDTGSEASNTWYYLYLIKKSSDGTVAGLFSTTNEAVTGSVTLPSGYDLKRQLPIAVRNDSSSNIMPFKIIGGSHYFPIIFYTGFQSSNSSGQASGDYAVLSGGTQTSFAGGANQSCASLVPSLSRAAYLHCGVQYTSNNASAFIRETGSGLSTGSFIGVGNAGAATPSIGIGEVFWQSLDGSQRFDYLVGSGSNLNIWVQGYMITEAV